MRRYLVVAAVAASSLSGGLLLTIPAAHADAGACVNAYVNVNGNELVNQQQCTPALPAPPTLPGQ